MKLVPARTSGNRWAPSRRRQRCWVMSSSLNAISRPLVLEPAPRVARSRSRTVANGDSITLVVRRCFQNAASDPRQLVWWMAIGAGAMLAVGLVDDALALSPGQKFSCQLAIIAWAAIFALPRYAFTPW